MLPERVPNRKELAIVFAKELPKYFNKAEIDAVLGTTIGDPKSHLLLSLLWQTGARVSEVLGISVKDVDFHTKTLRIISLKRKGRPQRAIPIQSGLVGLLGAYMAQNQLKRDDEIFSFTRQRAYQLVQGAVLAAGLDKERGHPHVFRHSFAVHAVLAGVPILVIKEWLGHTNIQSTLVYLKVLGVDTRHFYDNLHF